MIFFVNLIESDSFKILQTFWRGSTSPIEFLIAPIPLISLLNSGASRLFNGNIEWTESITLQSRALLLSHVGFLRLANDCGQSLLGLAAQFRLSSLSASILSILQIGALIFGLGTLKILTDQMDTHCCVKLHVVSIAIDVGAKSLFLVTLFKLGNQFFSLLEGGLRLWFHSQVVDRCRPRVQLLGVWWESGQHWGLLSLSPMILKEDLGEFDIQIGLFIVKFLVARPSVFQIQTLHLQVGVWA